ncbi:putative transcription factor AS2-LOB family [Rosa chinensis]|uniref:Putative transcription factor AS2-LOB family n=1 Tax=Rosa chinensis TaxID=74649 RepID=A0A2P6S354_ROSCH|nr:LOB domain-containing protein 41 [Rosa chinensis]PRQ53086.1 putative transcription factor AS2-LOB family [Rosa chinensis]
MRMSCNGCRILRKGCSENCSIRPCLQWIKSPESQANATVFLAKFYGRAGLMNLINAGPEHLRPAIFRSLLYEACGRIVNPIYGSVGLLWSGSWQLCQAAVENVLKGQPITPITSEAAASGHGPPLKAYDIRHVSKDENSAASNDPQKAKTRYRFKRSVGKPKQPNKTGSGSGVEDAAARFEAKPNWTSDEFNRSTSHESSLSHQSEAANVDGDSKETESMVSSETAEASLLFRAEPESSAHKRTAPVQENELGLELTLGFESSSRAPHVVPVKKRRVDASGFCGGSSSGDGACKMELGLA